MKYIPSHKKAFEWQNVVVQLKLIRLKIIFFSFRLAAFIECQKTFFKMLSPLSDDKLHSSLVLLHLSNMPGKVGDLQNSMLTFMKQSFLYEQP